MRTLLLAVVSRAFTSCGTMNVLYEDSCPRVFGGVAWNAKLLQENPDKHPFSATLAAIDFPFSVAGDIVTLPFALLVSVVRAALGDPFWPPLPAVDGKTAPSGSSPRVEKE